MANGKLTTGTLTPAYGRDYKSKRAVIADLNIGNMFVWQRMLDEGYVNISDLEGTFKVRWNRIMKEGMVTIADGVAK